MNNKKEKAFKLRLEGYSYNEIKKVLGIPKSTQSGWFKNLELPQKARERLRYRVYQKSVVALIRRNKLQTKIAIRRTKEVRLGARKQIEELTLDQLRLVGASLYWGEGYKHPYGNKTTHAVSFSNSDPNIIKIMMRFLREVCLVPEKKIKISLRIYPHMNEEQARLFWSKLTKIPVSQFYKTSYAISSASKRKRPRNRLPYGTIQLRVCDTSLFHKIMGWIDGISSYNNAGVA